MHSQIVDEPCLTGESSAYCEKLGRTRSGVQRTKLIRMHDREVILSERFQQLASAFNARNDIALGRQPAVLL